MEPITILLFAFGLLQTNSIDLVFGDDELIDGFVYVDDSIIILDTWEKSNNGYFGITEDNNYFYLVVTSEAIKIKIWAEEQIRLVEFL